VLFKDSDQFYLVLENKNMYGNFAGNPLDTVLLGENAKINLVVQ
jgi:hypothetical protein